jgi:alpha/beta superfamily hydrolase
MLRVAPAWAAGGLAAILLLAAANLRAAVADTARETRWADEIVPQLVVGDAVWIVTARQPRVLAIHAEPARPTRNAVIVVHGLGVHPDWNLIGVLRTNLVDAGFATLSVQMPVLAAGAAREDYADLLPDAADRLTAATAWLRARGYSHIAVVSHSMGAAMADAWLARAPPPSIDAWVPVGMFVGFAASPRQPVLDIVGERDFPEVLAQSKTRSRQLRSDGCSAALVVAGADHYFADSAARLAAAIAPFIERAFAGACAR